MLLGYEGDGSVLDNPPVAVSNTGGVAIFWILLP